MSEVVMPSVVEMLRDKDVSHGHEVVKKMRLSHPHDIEYPTAIQRAPTGGPNRGRVLSSYPLAANPTLPTPIVADKYQIFEQVEGSSLYRCVNIHNQEQLVCKILPKNNHMLVSAHYKLDSTRISSLQEVVVENNYLVLVFPKPHGDLHSYVRSRKKLRESEAKKLFRQIVETVQVCHNNGIVLRDLKLRKFVFADKQRTQLKLESLEDAVVLDNSESDWLHDKRGCPAYVSPEILKAGQYSGRAADMWSLGVILYTMLVGRYPFSDSEHASLFLKISKGNFAIPECVSPRARCLINSLLRRDPTERLTSEDILFHPWLARSECDWSSRQPCDQVVPQGWSMYD
ncbi:unnamed protein product [Brassicogethes aeneus]|uniref:Protein kinase domain-containing protein n=1 Tax=Brassicogethes aeneus TaxID=1431903 RepID=A0A9P0FJK5_BRAAE|nr:unnamed protein product [Brassicogethes aeneus]